MHEQIRRYSDQIHQLRLLLAELEATPAERRVDAIRRVELESSKHFQKLSALFDRAYQLGRELDDRATVAELAGYRAQQVRAAGEVLTALRGAVTQAGTHRAQLGPALQQLRDALDFQARVILTALTRQADAWANRHLRAAAAAR